MIICRFIVYRYKYKSYSQIEFTRSYFYLYSFNHLLVNFLFVFFLINLLFFFLGKKERKQRKFQILSTIREISKTGLKTI